MILCGNSLRFWKGLPKWFRLNIDMSRIVNKLLRVKDNIAKVKFSVADRFYEAYVPEDAYWIAVKDILLNREYEYLTEFHVENLKGFTVIDVGAHVGLYSLIVSGYARKVISIEPHPINFRLLEVNRILNGLENVETLNVTVVGQKSVKYADLYEADHSGGHSIIRKKTSSRLYQVPATTLSEITEHHVRGAGDKVLIKMDIEGAEFDVFKSLDRNLLSSVERLVMEVHLKYGSLDVVVDRLRSTGFNVRWFHPPLITRDAKPPIRLRNMIGLKILRTAVYFIAKSYNLKDRDLVILFAWRS